MDANKDNVIQLEEFIAYLPEDVKDASDPFLFLRLLPLAVRRAERGGRSAGGGPLPGLSRLLAFFVGGSSGCA
jgi:hypothetical protein